MTSRSDIRDGDRTRLEVLVYSRVTAYKNKEQALRRLDGLALLAYAVAAVFIVMGLVALAGGDANIGANKVFRHPVHMGGGDRHVFGASLLAAGYVLWRWVFRQPGAERRMGIELRIVAVFVAIGYLAYLIGG